MFRPQMVLLITALACSSLLAAPPVRTFDDPGAPPFKLLKEGENPPLDANDNLVVGPKYVPAPARNKVDGVPEGKVEQFVVDSMLLRQRTIRGGGRRGANDHKFQAKIGGNSCKKTKFVMFSMRTGTLRRSEMRTRNTISTQTMPSANTLSRVNESSGELIYRRCGAIIQASLQVSTSGESSEKVISGLPNTSSPTKGDQHTR